MRVSIFGLGYVGCVTGGCLARAGHEVIGVDVSEDKVAMVNSGRSPVVEPGLAELLSEVVRNGKLRASSSTQDAVHGSDLALLCVGTPSRSNGQLDVGAVQRVGQQIGRALRKRRVPYTVVLRSTVLPGTCETVLAPALWEGAWGPLPALRLAVNPEFMREGSSLQDFGHPPLTLVGCQEPETARQLRALYEGVEAPFVHTAVRTAEMVKYVANAFHALKATFANEIGDACEAFGVDPHDLMTIFAMDRKLNISEAYLRPGFAFGGSCLPKDLRALLYAARTADLGLPLLSSVLPANEAQMRRGVDQVLAARKRRVGIIGLSFKPGTDDLRESPMVVLAETLIGKGCDVRILDRNVSVARLVGANRRFIEEEIPHISALMCETLEELLAHAEVLVLGATEPDASAALRMAGPQRTIVDLTRGALGRTAAASERPPAASERPSAA
jgi:GDP-mannose 6-dehydrogenase